MKTMTVKEVAEITGASPRTISNIANMHGWTKNGVKTCLSEEQANIIIGEAEAGTKNTRLLELHYRFILLKRNLEDFINNANYVRDTLVKSCNELEEQILLILGNLTLDKQEYSKFCGVYFIRSASSGLVKIGSTTDIRNRIRSFDLHSPDELVIELFISTDRPRLEEYEFHKQFERVRLRGEWFSISPEEINECRDTAISAGLTILERSEYERT